MAIVTNDPSNSQQSDKLSKTHVLACAAFSMMWLFYASTALLTKLTNNTKRPSVQTLQSPTFEDAPDTRACLRVLTRAGIFIRFLMVLNKSTVFVGGSLLRVSGRVIYHRMILLQLINGACYLVEL